MGKVYETQKLEFRIQKAVFGFSSAADIRNQEPEERELLSC